MSRRSLLVVFAGLLQVVSAGHLQVQMFFSILRLGLGSQP
jgi:hypothetical protein